MRGIVPGDAEVRDFISLISFIHLDIKAMFPNLFKAHNSRLHHYCEVWKMYNMYLLLIITYFPYCLCFSDLKRRFA